MNTVNEVMMNEAITFGLYFLAVILFGVCWRYIVRNWSWIPRRQQRSGFRERF